MRIGQRLLSTVISLSLLLALLLALVEIAQTGALAQELAANGGFETGDFTGWTQFGSDHATGVTDLLLGTYGPHEGADFAYFGAIGATGGLSQDLTTTPGGIYNISFWLSNLKGPINSASVDFGGVNLLTIANAAPFDYTRYDYTVVANSATTTLSFNFRQDPSYYLLDSVSVRPAGTAVPEFGSVCSLGALLATGGCGLWLKRRRQR